RTIAGCSTDLNSTPTKTAQTIGSDACSIRKLPPPIDKAGCTIGFLSPSICKVGCTIRKVAPSIGNIIHRLINGTTDRKWQAPARSIRKSLQNPFLLPNEPTTFTCIHSEVPSENVEGIVGRFWCKEGNIETNIINYGWVLE